MKITQKAAKIEYGSAGFQIREKIEVAIQPVFAGYNGPEHTDITAPMATSRAEDLSGVSPFVMSRE